MTFEKSQAPFAGDEPARARRDVTESPCENRRKIERLHQLFFAEDVPEKLLLRRFKKATLMSQ
jgi:hypothetical protein